MQLFSLTLTNEPAFVSRIAHHALMQIGAAEPVQFVITLAENPMRSARHFDPREYSHALSVIGNLVKKKPVYLLPGMHENENENEVAPLRIASHSCNRAYATELPRLVEAVVHSLDPNVPSLRDSCLKAATSVLHSIVSKFPMISFHQETQRLAVGTNRGSIIIYDLKSASRVHVLDAFSVRRALALSPQARDPTHSLARALRCGASVSSSLQSLHWPTLLMEGCVSHCHSSCCVTLASSALTLAVVMCRCWRAFRSMRLK